MNTEENTNENIKLITGDPKRAIRKLAWPMMIATFLTMAYNLIDGIWISGLGTNALAGLGFVTPLYMIVAGLGTGLGAGANSLIARYIGAKNKKMADNSAIHSLVLTIIISAIITLIFTVFLKQLLLVMGVGANIMPSALNYGYVVFAGSIVFIFSNVGAGILRAEGDVNRAMYTLAITAILNCILDPIFIYTLKWGMAGAAWASVLSALISCIIMLYWLFIEKKTYISYTREDFNYKNSIMKNLLNVGIPASADIVIVSILAIVLNYILTIVSGAYGVAVYSAGHRIFLMTLVPHVGIGTAVLTTIGVAYGARNFEKMKVGFNYALKLGIISSLIMCIFLFIFAEQISCLFAYTSTSADLVPGISLFIRIIVIQIMALPIGLIPTYSFQSMGKGLNSLITILIRSFIFTIIFVYILTMIIPLKITGVWIGYSIGGLIGAILSYIWIKYVLNSLNKTYANNKKTQK
ncbi:MAG: MATE family efflux transporter [Methanobrevibacter sp.]|jgi:putative MATE family efflux protein|nr:MATE family efflux transporter [Candidatus Methanoflexus mossambicus]